MMNRDTNSPFAISLRRVVNGDHVSAGQPTKEFPARQCPLGAAEVQLRDKKSTVLQCPGLYLVTLCWMLEWKENGGHHLVGASARSLITSLTSYLWRTGSPATDFQDGAAR